MKWRIRDLIDLEYFLYQDAAGPAQDENRARDRAIFLKLAAGASANSGADRRLLLRAWLDRRREETRRTAAILPGESFASLHATLRLLFLGVGLVGGATAAGSYLTYTGARPVNVFVYLAVFVGSQLLLLALLLALALFRLSGKSPPAAAPLYRLIGRSILRTLLATRRQLSDKLSAERRLETEALVGIIMGKTRAYGSLLFLPAFLLTQLFAIGLNGGLLGATLFKVATADIAFGWQSTMQLSPAGVHLLVRATARPWSWAVPGDAAFPSLAQIEGSRIILKEGIYHLSTPNLVSWWPFLCLAVAVYGLLPRLLLFAGGAAALHRRLAALDFRQGAHEQLLLRMTTPLVTTKGQEVGGQATATAESSPPIAHQGPTAMSAALPARDLLVLIPDELHAAASPEEIETVVNQGQTFRVRGIVPTGRDYAADLALLNDLHQSCHKADTDILLIQEAWQPPILESLDFIRQLRAAVGSGPCIRIGLIGRPGPDTIFTHATSTDRDIWARKISTLGDPCLFCGGLMDDAP